MTTATALTLDRGTHDSAEEGACLLELVSLLAGEEFSDAPRCVSPVLANAGRAWNDSLGDEERERLLGDAGPARRPGAAQRRPGQERRLGGGGGAGACG